MVKTLLVPLDGSSLAEQALPYATALAAGTRAEIFLVRAARARVLPGVDAGDAEVGVVENAEEYLAHVTASLPSNLKVGCGVYYGDPVTGIVEESRLRDVGLVVMATHGRSGLGRWVYGSVAEGVLHRTPVPVLLVRAWRGAAGAGSLQAAGPMLVPLDGSSFAEAVLPAAMELASQLGSSLTLLQVAGGEQVGLGAELWATPHPGVRADRLADAQAYLRAVGERLTREHAGLKVDMRTEWGEPAEAICSAAQTIDAGLVAMATHGRTGLGRTLLGSVAGGVLREGRTPLLLVRPAGLSAEVPPERA